MIHQNNGGFKSYPPGIHQDISEQYTHQQRHWRQVVSILGKRNGLFAVIKRGSKLPTRKGWNKAANGIDATAAKRHLGAGDNITLLAGTGGLYAFDFDYDAARGHECHQLANGLYTYRDNAPQKAKFIFYCADTIPTRLKSKSHGIDLLGVNGNGTHWSCVIAGTHNSGASILWGGSNVPVLPADTVAALWEEWTGLALFAPEREEGEADTVYANADLALVADAFEYADPHDPEMDYGSWIGIIAAVHDAFGDDALDLVVDWADGKRGEVEGKWHTFDREYTGKGTTLKSLFYFARRGGWIDPTPEVAPLPEGATVLDNGHVILKTTPTPEPPKRPAPPVLTPTVVEKLGQVLRGLAATMLLDRLPHARNREMYRDVLIQLVTVIAPKKGSWVFDADQRWLGEKLGKSGMSAGRNMKVLDDAGIIRYLHTGKTDDDSKVGRPLMQVDLQPLISMLWESCVNVTNTNPDPEFVTFRNDPPTNVYATYSGAGKFADASMRTPYKHAVARMGFPTVLARSLPASALTVLDYLTRDGYATRAELVEETGMSPGSASGGTRVLEQLGVVSVEWDGPGTPKVYVLRPDWESHLRMLIPHMASYGAWVRLVIRGFDERIEYDEWKLKCSPSPAVADDLREHKKKLESARKKWCIYANKIGAYGRYAEANPPW